MRTLLLSMALLGTLLAACGGGNHDDDATMTLSLSPSGSGGPTSDKFAGQVASLVASAPDDAEPAAVDGIAATMPDNTEPQAAP